MNLLGRVLPILFVTGLTLLPAETAHGQMPLRGRYVKRDGLFHAERFHWGGGISANGVAAINAIVPVLNNAVTTFGGKDLQEDKELDAAQKALSDATWLRYEQQQAAANRLLVESAGLMNVSIDLNSLPAVRRDGTPAAPISNDNVWSPRPNGASAGAVVP